MPLRNKRWSKSIFLKGLPIDVFEIGKRKKDKLLLLQYASGQWTWIGLLLSLQYSGPTFHHTKDTMSPLLSMSMDILHITQGKWNMFLDAKSHVNQKYSHTLSSNHLLESPMEKNNIFASNKALPFCYYKSYWAVILPIWHLLLFNMALPIPTGMSNLRGVS